MLGGEGVVFSIHEMKLGLEHKDFIYYYILMSGEKTKYIGTDIGKFVNVEFPNQLEMKQIT